MAHTGGFISTQLTAALDRLNQEKVSTRTSQQLRLGSVIAVTKLKLNLVTPDHS